MNFDDIFGLLKQLYTDLPRDKTKEIFEAQQEDPDTISLAVKEERVVGYAAAKMRTDIQTQSKVAMLTELIIDKGRRGNGLGTKLLKDIMKLAKENGCSELQFSSTFKREDAHRFYESLGFQKTAYFFWKEI